MRIVAAIDVAFWRGGRAGNASWRVSSNCIPARAAMRSPRSHSGSCQNVSRAR
ncbi:hypothetical protein [Cronobacter sakazakii]|uniref:hypothetical protein n=1 Tax=Cronobacter sakazakii TaxID=28141 RepID=UPI003081F9C9